MTGNNKVWRAPVAGLASVAMLATLGVSAMTANAAETAEASVTIHGNGLKIEYKDGGKTKSVDDYTIKYSYDPAVSGAQAAKLGKIVTDLSTVAAEVTDADLVVPGNDTFTGFYKSAAYGVENDAFNAGTDVATDLYAHYGDNGNQIVSVNWTPAGANYTSHLPSALAAKDGKLDRIADWQVPTDDSVSDNNLVDYYTVQGDKVDSLTGDFTNKVDYNTQKSLNVSAELVDSADIVYVNFNNWGTTAGHEYIISGSSPTTYALASGESFSTRYAKLPVATAKSDSNTVATKWATRKSDGKDGYVTDKVFSVTDPVTTDLQLYVAETATTYTVTFADEAGQKIQEVEVAKGDTVAKPADPTKAENESLMIRYTFDKWLNGDKEYDFSQPVNSDLTLTASFKESEVGVSFDPAYDNKEAEVIWFKTGDTFKVPENPTRDGYTFLGWYDVNRANATAFVGAKLRIENGYLQRIVTNSTGTPSGSNTTWKSIVNRNFTAAWDEADPEDTLAELEGNVPDSFLRNANNGYKSGDEQSVFTADSFDQYVSDYQDYLAAKDVAKTSGSVITNEEAADLYEQLSEAQSKLVFKATKTMQRWQKNDQHIYTDSAQEQKNLKLAGWKHEALADFDTVDTKSIYAEAPEAEAEAIINGLLTKVSRLREYATGNYMLTADENEIKVLTSDAKTWKNETFSAVYTPKNGTVEADRFYVNYNGEHLIITDAEESAALKADPANFHYDGVKFWVY